jgi:crossover junction endodeoxyribonuclease RusA
MLLTFNLQRQGKVKQAISSNDRLHVHQKAKLTKSLRSLGMYEAVSHYTSRHTWRPYSEERPCKMTVTVYGPTARKFDPPNFWPSIKALQDGMTDARVWTDDNYDIIKELTFRYGGQSGKKGFYRFETEIEDYEDPDLIRDRYDQLIAKHRAVKEALGLEYETGLADTLEYIKRLRKEAE